MCASFNAILTKVANQVLLTREEEVMNVCRSKADIGDDQASEMIDSSISTGTQGHVMVVILGKEGF